MLWTFLLPFGSAFAQDPVAILAVGDRPAPSLTEQPPPPDSWVQALQDCLNEKRPEGFQVVDRRIPGETVTTLKTRLEELASLAPAHVVIRLGSNPDTEALSALVGALVTAESTAPAVVLLPFERPDPPPTAPAPTADATAESAATPDPSAPRGTWADLATHPRVTVLAEGPWHLTEQGNARVGARLCEAILPPVPTPQTTEP